MLEDYPDGPLTRYISTLLESQNERPVFHMVRSRWKEGRNSAYENRDKTVTIDGVKCLVGSKTNFPNESHRNDSALSCFLNIDRVTLREDLHSPSLAQDYNAADRVLVMTMKVDGQLSESTQEAYRGQPLRSIIELPPTLDRLFGWRIIKQVRTIVPTYTDVELSTDNWDNDLKPA